MDRIVMSFISEIISNKELFPEYGVKIIINLFFLLVVIILIKSIAKSLQDPELIKAALFIGKKTKNVSRTFIKGASEAVESPIKRPKVKFLATVLSSINSYIMSLVFLCFSFGIGYLIYLSKSDTTWYQQIGSAMLLALLVWFTLFFRAQGDKDYVSAKTQWSDRDKWKVS